MYMSDDYTKTTLMLISYGSIPCEVEYALRRPEVRQTLELIYDHGKDSWPREDSWFDKLVAHEIFRRSEGQLLPGRRLKRISEAAVSALLQSAEVAAPAYAQSVVNIGDELRRLYKTTTPAMVQGFTWSQVADLVISGLFLDLAAGQRFLERFAGKVDVEKDYWVWVLRVPVDYNTALFGVRIVHHAGLRVGLGQLWTHPRRSPGLTVIEEDLQALHVALQGKVEGLDEVSLTRSCLKLRQLGVLRGEGEKKYLAVPVFTAREMNLLLTQALALSDQPVSKVIPYAIRLPYRSHSESVNLMQLFYRFLMENTRRYLRQMFFCLSQTSSSYYWVWLGDSLMTYMSRALEN